MNPATQRNIHLDAEIPRRGWLNWANASRRDSQIPAANLSSSSSTVCSASSSDDLVASSKSTPLSSETDFSFTLEDALEENRTQQYAPTKH